VPSDAVEPLDVSSADIMTFIVSGGVSGLGIGEKGESIPPTSIRSQTLIIEPKRPDPKS
jgi:hypothetical protein